MRVKLILLTIASVFLAWMVAAPYLCAYGTITGLDGQVAIIDNQKLWDSIDVLPRMIYTLGDFFCHQMESRTFMLNGNEMPFCVRDFAILIGFVAGIVLVLARNVKRSKTTDVIIVCSILLIIFDWATQNIFSSDVVFTRMLTGILAGASIAMFICFVIDRLDPEQMAAE